MGCRYPNLRSVKELVFKKGVGIVDKQSVPLTDNNIIEQVTDPWKFLLVNCFPFHMIVF